MEKKPKKVKKNSKPAKKSLQLTLEGNAAFLVFDLSDEFHRDKFKKSLEGPNLSLAIDEFYSKLRNHIKYDVPFLNENDLNESQLKIDEELLRRVENAVLYKVRDVLRETVAEHLEDY